MTVLVEELRLRGMRVLAYLDFLIAPSLPVIVAGLGDCADVKVIIDGLLRQLGIIRHPEKGEWSGSQELTHLGVEIDSKDLRFRVAPYKIVKVQKMASDHLRKARFGRRWVGTRALSHFCGVCVSLSLAMPCARFYTRSLYWDMTGKSDRRGRCRLSHQGIRDLVKWNSLTKQDLEGRQIHRPAPQASMYTEAADEGYGGTLHLDNMEAGKNGQFSSQGF